ncbi:hypothetical protein [Jannaschia sp. R86511]|uniref:hypothetical protein n=1 Tax=Jannaschia sp. R86511 TaxID=3093853 RepID=UPI0036D3BBE8
MNPETGTQADDSPVLASLTVMERNEVLGVLLEAHPELQDEAERMAQALLSTTSVEQVAAEVEAALARIPVEALAVRAGRVHGRGYVHETEAAGELLEETREQFRADLERLACLNVKGAASHITVGIVAGLHRVRDPEVGTVPGYAGEDAAPELAASVLHLSATLRVVIPDDAPGEHWPSWADRL